MAASIDSLARLCTTRSTNTSKVLLIDYFIRVVAENGEGEILTVVQDMPSLPRAVTLPEVSNLISDYKELVQELGKTSREITQERKSRDEEKTRVAEAEAVKAKERAEQVLVPHP